MEVHRKYIMEGQFYVYSSLKKEQKEEKDAKFLPFWLLLFNDILIFATGSRIFNKIFTYVFIKVLIYQKENCITPYN